MATRKYAYCQEPSKIILPLTAQRICAIGSSRDKKSSHSFAKLSAWYVRKGGTPAPEQKPSHRQRHRLQATNAESIARLFVTNRAEKLR